MLNETNPGPRTPAVHLKDELPRPSYALSGIAAGIPEGRRTENTQ